MIKLFLLSAINFYQKFISPGLPKSCRFWPSCSNYCQMSVKKYGAFKGFLKGIGRLARCYPWHKGGIDLP